MADLKPILLVEDNPKDLELTLAALEQCQLANSVETVRDGAEALDYLYRRGSSKGATARTQRSFCSTSNCRRSMVSKFLSRSRAIQACATRPSSC